MVQLRHSMRFGKKALYETVIDGDVRGHDLQGDFTVKIHLNRLVNDRHSAPVNLFNYAVLADLRADRKECPFNRRKHVANTDVPLLKALRYFCSGRVHSHSLYSVKKVSTSL